MKIVIKLLSPFLFFLIKIYWFIFRPRTFGVRVILTHADEILFVKHTYGKKYIFPGGGIKRGESLEDAARREVLEEVGIKLGQVTHLKTFLDTGEFKRDTISVFTSEVQNREVNIHNLEIDDAEWRELTNPPSLGRVACEILEIYKEYRIVKQGKNIIQKEYSDEREH